MRSKEKGATRPRGRSPPDILSYSYPCRPGPRRATQRKKPCSLCSPEQTRHDWPPFNVRLRMKYSTRIREVKNIPRQRKLLIVLVLILQAKYLSRSPRGGHSGPVAEFAWRACRPGRAPAFGRLMTNGAGARPGLHPKVRRRRLAIADSRAFPVPGLPAA